mmetsp:Transcript_15990/g.36614  ORF Transcript_15990/g.36614 Transcript_15990/m.36614 type:complete len:182 (+) Transcript_15990:62-607(+)
MRCVAAFAGAAASGIVGSCGGQSPSPVPDCGNVDMGSCGNACCKLSIEVPISTTEAMQTLNASLANGGPDGYFTLQPTAEGTLGFGDLRPFKTGVDFIGQVHHMTSGPKHYNDTIDITLTSTAAGTMVKAFSLSLIGGALGDNGQSYKNIKMAMDGAFKSTGYKLSHADDSCPEPEFPLLL